MKIVVNCAEQVTVEVVPAEGQQTVTFTDLVASLEMAKMIVLNDWKVAMNQGGVAESVEQTDVEVSD